MKPGAEPLHEVVAEGGYGAGTHGGRLSFGDPEDRVRAAMTRLLELGGAPASLRVSRGGSVPLWYLDAGEGLPLVLLHGGSGGSANWYRLIGPLARRYRVLAPDLPGFGLTPALPDTRQRSSLSVTGAHLLLDWLDGIGASRFAIAGTSYGGLLALRVAQARPAAVLRIALIDAVGLGRSIPWAVRLAGLPLLRHWLVGPGPAGGRWLFRRLLVAPEAVLPAAEERVLLEYLRASAAAAPRGWLAQVVAEFGGPAGQREVLSACELAEVRQPTLVVWGARDAFLPLDHGRFAAAALPRALLRVLPSSGHSPNWEVPEQLCRVLEAFLGAGPRAP